MSTADPIPRRRLSEQLAERLLARIAAGDPAAGEALPSEAALAQRHGVGRPTVREALQKLEAMGVVQTAHGAPARVVRPDPARMLEGIAASFVHLVNSEPETIGHLQEARLMMEEAMMRRVAARGVPAAAEAALAAQERAIIAGEGFLAADMEFHVALSAGAGNPLFPAFLRAVLDCLAAFHASTVRLSGFERLALDEHRQVMAALRAGDGEAAARAMRAHLTRSSSLYGPHRRGGVNR